jgi:hypothetical protein
MLNATYLIGPRIERLTPTYLVRNFLYHTVYPSLLPDPLGSTISVGLSRAVVIVVDI